jgi:hypothetical protein
MSKTPEIVTIAKRENLKFLNDFTNLPVVTGMEACLNEEPDLFFSEFALDIVKAKTTCNTCPLLESCGTYALKHENFGVWGGMTAEERFEIRGNHFAYEATDVERLNEQMKFIMTAPALEVAERYGAQTRTVVRWRNSIRDAQKAS